MRAANIVAVLMAISVSAIAGEGPRLINGSFSDGGDVPVGWTKTHADKGKLSVRRDTTVFKKGPASMCVMAVGGPASGNVNQALTGVAGKTLRVTGFARRERKEDEIQVFMMPFSKQWKFIEWKMLAAQNPRTPQGPGAWHAFDATYTVPGNAGRVMFGLLLKGKAHVLPVLWS